jgi:hypothetical protein
VIELAAYAVLRQMRYGPWPVQAPDNVWRFLEKRGFVRAVTMADGAHWQMTGPGSQHLDKADLEEAERERDGAASFPPRKAGARAS